MERYLIAGASGFVGSRLAEQLLADGHFVRALVYDSESEAAQRLAARGAVVWEADVTRPETLVGVASGISVVFNLIGCPVLDHRSARQVLVEGNRNLIAACSRSRTVRSYLYAGSSAVYGDRGDDWLTEDAAPQPCHPLGAAAVEAELAILDLARRHGFPAILLRVATIYGRGRGPIEALRSGTATLIGDGRNFLAHIHADDLTAALVRLAHDGQPGAIYNVADDEPVRAADLYATVARRLGLPAPRPFPRAAALAVGMDPTVVGVASSSLRLSNARLREELELTLRFPSIRAWLDMRLPEPAEQLLTAEVGA